MKSSGHPVYFSEAQVICVCGNKFTTGSTQEVIHVELCSACHPFYTGEQKFVDTASKIEKFKKRQEVASQYAHIKVKKDEDRKKADQGPKTLREMLMAAK